MLHPVRLLVLLAAVLGLLAGCAAPPPPPSSPPDAARELRRGRLFAAALIRETRDVADADSVQPEAALALGYLERLRLGLGSPFRLTERALRDPRLPDSVRAPLAWALLARTLDGRAYEVDPELLASMGAREGRPALGSGDFHLEVMERAVEDARDPRTGEAGVRMAYAIAAAGGDAGRRAPTLATRTAALLRDRRLAREDARALLLAADSAEVSPLELLPAWRSGRRFRVEAPLILPPDADAEGEALRTAVRLAARLRTAAETGPPRMHVAPLRAPHRGLLGPGAAARLAEVAEQRELPPQAAVATTVRSFRDYLFAGIEPEGPQAEVRRRFLRRALGEERFVAELAVLRHAGIEGAGPEAVALAVGVALRPMAQEPVWFPGFPAPTERELRTRFGLASVSFGDSVPEAWRPYYLRMLETSLRDLALVFPSFSVRGLHVRVAEVDREEALATHAPSPRTLTLPPTTAAGTLAHEVAHDLDWQAALARYGVRGAYRTDRAVSYRGDHLAAAVRALAGGPLEPVARRRGERPSPERRPAEVFARNVDWFVAASLARRGLSNGYLTSVQDAVLTGYAGAMPPDPEGRAAEATARILGEVAPVPDQDLRWFLEVYGPGRLPPAEAAVRDILESPLPTYRAAVRGEETVPACTHGGARTVLRQDPLRGEVLALAARARARGEALEQADRLAGPEGRAWLARQLDGMLWSPVSVDSATAELLDPLVRRVEELDRTAAPPSPGGSPFAFPAAECGRLPAV